MFSRQMLIEYRQLLVFQNEEQGNGKTRRERYWCGCWPATVEIFPRWSRATATVEVIAPVRNYRQQIAFSNSTTVDTNKTVQLPQMLR
ncbi:hypothetical protein NYV35_25680 [Escherichia coli]|nr:hypothetical protein [Escherichia coli]